MLNLLKQVALLKLIIQQFLNKNDHNNGEHEEPL